MKKLAALVFVFALSAVSVKLMAQTQQAQPATAQPAAAAVKALPAAGGAAAPATTQKKDDEHPHMDAAKKALENAKAQLEQAAHDYNGHRVKALDLVNQAIKEINEGIASDKDKK
jgi:hypothetical protein